MRKHKQLQGCLCKWLWGKSFILTCILGILSPPTFSCSPNPCSAPSGILNAAGTSCQRSTVGSGSSGTTACASGYTASLSAPSCSWGTLSTSTILLTTPMLSVEWYFERCKYILPKGFQCEQRKQLRWCLLCWWLFSC